MGTLLSGRVAAGLLQVAAIALLARSLGVETFGRYVAFLAGLYLAMNAFDFGFGTRLLRIGAEDDVKSTTTWMFTIRSLSNLVVVLLGSMVWTSRVPEPWLFGCAIAVYATGDTFGDLGLSYLLGRGRVRASALFLIGRRLVAIAPFMTGHGMAQATAALFAAGLAGVLTAYLAMRDAFTRPSRFRSFVQQSVPYWGLSGVQNLQKTDTILVAAVAGPTVAGLYGSATRLLGPLNLVTSVLQHVFVPRLSQTRSLEDRRAQWRRLFRVASLVGCLLLLGTLASPIAVRVIFGQEFRNGWPVLAAVCVAAALNGVSEAYLAWIYAEGAQLRLSFLTAGAVLLGLGLLTVLCWRFGIGGAAVALVVPYLLLALLYRHVSGQARAGSPVPGPAKTSSEGAGVRHVE